MSLTPNRWWINFKRERKKLKTRGLYLFSWDLLTWFFGFIMSLVWNSSTGQKGIRPYAVEGPIKYFFSNTDMFGKIRNYGDFLFCWQQHVSIQISRSFCEKNGDVSLAACWIRCALWTNNNIEAFLTDVTKTALTGRISVRLSDNGRDTCPLRSYAWIQCEEGHREYCWLQSAGNLFLISKFWVFLGKALSSQLLLILQ